MKLLFNLIKISLAIIVILSIWKLTEQIKDSFTPSNKKQSMVRAESPPLPPTCDVKPRSVHDGDTLRVLCNGQESKIRFACVDAPELKQAGGIEARDHLRSLLSNANNKVKVKAITTDRYGSTVAELYFRRGNNWQLVQLQQVKDGMVWGYDEYKNDCPSWNAISKAETEAQRGNRGLWAENPTPPWEWRKLNR